MVAVLLLALCPGLLLAVLRVPCVRVARLAALVLLLVVCGAALAPTASLRGLANRTTAHYGGLAAEVQSGWMGDGRSLLLLDSTGLYRPQGPIGAAALAPALLRQALLLGLRESGTVVLWIALLGLAAGLVILGAGLYVRARRAPWPATRAEVEPDDPRDEPLPARWW